MSRRNYKNNVKKEHSEYKVITVVVRIIDLKTDEVEREVVKIIDGPERREWLNAQIMWAMFNHKYIEVINKEDISFLFCLE